MSVSWGLTCIGIDVLSQIEWPYLLTFYCQTKKGGEDKFTVDGEFVQLGWHPVLSPFLFFFMCVFERGRGVVIMRELLFGQIFFGFGFMLCTALEHPSEIGTWS